MKSGKLDKNPGVHTEGNPGRIEKKKSRGPVRRMGMVRSAKGPLPFYEEWRQMKKTGTTTKRGLGNSGEKKTTG